jgi:hypothetical protein
VGENGCGPNCVWAGAGPLGCEPEQILDAQWFASRWQDEVGSRMAIIRLPLSLL